MLKCTNIHLSSSPSPSLLWRFIIYPRYIVSYWDVTSCQPSSFTCIFAWVYMPVCFHIVMLTIRSNTCAHESFWPSARRERHRCQWSIFVLAMDQKTIPQRHEDFPSFCWEKSDVMFKVSNGWIYGEYVGHPVAFLTRMVLFFKRNNWKQNKIQPGGNGNWNSNVCICVPWFSN